MAKIYGNSDAIGKFMSALRNKDINRFHSFEEVINFKHRWKRKMNAYIRKVRDELIQKEMRKSRNKELSIECLAEIESQVNVITEDYVKTRKHITRVIRHINHLYKGALGEYSTIKELRKLSNSFLVINDYNVKFNDYLNYTKEKSIIKKCQIDHLLIGPSGIFVFETKHWRKSNYKRPSEIAPFEHLNRAEFVIHNILKKSNEDYLETKFFDIGLNKYKIPIIKILVLTGKLESIDSLDNTVVLQPPKIKNFISSKKPFLDNNEVNKLFEILQGKYFDYGSINF